MSTKIPYCELTWPVTAGCTKCEIGCKNCWAIKSAQRLKGKGIRGYDKVVDKDGWTGHIELMPWNLDKPLHWRKPRRIFVNSMSDLFHPDVTNEYRHKVFTITQEAFWHTYLIFTKRVDELLAFVGTCIQHDKFGKPIEPSNGKYYHACYAWPHPNVQFILSLSTQKEAEEKIPILLQIPAAVRGLSLEPLLEPMDLRCVIVGPRRRCVYDCLRGCAASESGVIYDNVCGSVGWVIIGCESLPGGKAGRFQDGFIEAAINLVHQCQAASVPVYVKQIPINGKVSRKMNEWPKELQVKQYP